MTPDEQLHLWVEGESVHNNDDRDECCPDFSCCRPELKADEFTRRAFATAKEPERTKMLMMFLGSCLSGQKVYITDGRGLDD